MQLLLEGAILKFLAVIVTDTIYNNVKVITVYSQNTLITLPSDDRVTLADIEEPNIANTTAALNTAPLVDK